MLKMNSIWGFLFCLFAIASATDYCNEELCKEYNGDEVYYVPHISCNDTGEFGPACSADAKVFKLTQANKDLILKVHNTFRSTVGRGKLPGFASAKRLCTMVWNKELASIAESNARRCEQKHDECRNTDNFLFAGQNLATRSWSGMEITEATNIEYLINLWFKEYVDSSQSEVDLYQRRPSGSKATGHFTAMIHEKSCEIGCSVVKYTAKKNQKLYLVCNYSFTNLEGEPIYRKGIVGSECKTGPNKLYPGLCSLNEKIISEEK